MRRSIAAKLFSRYTVLMELTVIELGTFAYLRN